jgi:hypothetical protein
MSFTDLTGMLVIRTVDPPPAFAAALRPSHIVKYVN